ncbi:inorganic pyrophosphatase [candidate division KSB1 bacterium]|nr:MAG: inorganic pyrophosphatase [candidate division KSB1 bacterium]
MDVGVNPPEVVHAYIEITPFDLVKYEVDKSTGYMKVDRPQRTSSQPPALYGFIPRTYGGKRVSLLSPNAQRGDGDPLDICVISERPITRGEVFLNARVIGGLRMTDHGEADDKIIGVLENDEFWSYAKDISDLPDVLVERLKHYFCTYKLVEDEKSKITIEEVYNREKAMEVVNASIEDYNEEFGEE